jgi:hypothetical protein
MNQDDMSAVAVVNGEADAMAIWHVAAEPVAQTSRLCGAWVTDDPDVQQNVTAARKVVLLDAESKDRIAGLLPKAQGVIDLKATSLAIARHIDELSEIHRASRTPKGTARAPINWPSMQPIPEPDVPPMVPTGVVEDPIIRTTIAMARWIADLADTWSSVEMIRTSREHLSGGNPVPLPLPFVLDSYTA